MFKLDSIMSSIQPVLFQRFHRILQIQDQSDQLKTMRPNYLHTSEKQSGFVLNLKGL